MKRKAFTLIELLVVIAIIGLLLAIIVPSLQSVKELASVANCLVNQKNIALAFRAYAMDNDDNMCSGYVEDDMNVREAPSWIKAPLVRNGSGGWSVASDAQLNTETRKNGLRAGALFPYLETTDVFHCPGDKRIKFGASRYFTDGSGEPISVYQIYNSYGMPDFYRVNGSVNGVDHEKKLFETIMGFMWDPVGFVYFNYPWGEKNTSLANEEGPDDWQIEYLDDLALAMLERHNDFLQGKPITSVRFSVRSGNGPGNSGNQISPESQHLDLTMREQPCRPSRSIP